MNEINQTRIKNKFGWDDNLIQKSIKLNALHKGAQKSQYEASWDAWLKWLKYELLRTFSDL